MLYSVTNVQTSLTLDLASRLRAAGYAVRWQTSGLVEDETAGLGTPRATVTLVKEAPATPEHIVRLNEGDTPGEHEVAIPALSLHLPAPEQKMKRLGLGHTEFFRQRDILIDGLAQDEFEQTDLEALFNTWYGGSGVLLSVSDYTDEENPVSLAPVEVIRAVIGTEEAETEIDAVRYYLFARLTIEYVE